MDLVWHLLTKITDRLEISEYSQPNQRSFVDQLKVWSQFPSVNQFHQLSLLIDRKQMKRRWEQPQSPGGCVKRRRAVVERPLSDWRRVLAAAAIDPIRRSKDSSSSHWWLDRQLRSVSPLGSAPQQTSAAESLRCNHSFGRWIGSS